MTNPFAPDDDEKAAFRLDRWLGRIPPALAQDGELHEGVARWVKTLVGAGLTARKVPNLVIVGDPGTGKTWQVWHGVETAHRQGWAGQAIYCGAGEWRTWTKPTSPGRDRDLEVAKQCGVLVLDDLGALRLGEWDLECLYLIIEYRWGQLRPTVVTSNVKDLRGMVGDRIASRLAANAAVIELGGGDRRRQA